VTLKVCEPVNERRLGASALVTRRTGHTVLNGSGLEVNTAFSIHAWNSGIRDTDRFGSLEGSLKMNLMSFGDLSITMDV
jgi:hypothetical protein